MNDDDYKEMKHKMRWKTTLVIESVDDPRKWDLDNFYWASQNSAAHIIRDRTTKIKPRKKPDRMGPDLK